MNLKIILLEKLFLLDSLMRTYNKLWGYSYAANGNVSPRYEVSKIEFQENY